MEDTIYASRTSTVDKRPSLARFIGGIAIAFAIITLFLMGIAWADSKPSQPISGIKGTPSSYPMATVQARENQRQITESIRSLERSREADYQRRSREDAERGLR